MKNKAFLGVCGLLVFLAFSLPGCRAEVGGGDGNGIDDTAYNAVKLVPVTPKELREAEPEYGVLSPVPGGANDFAFRLSAALAKQAGTENLVCSPLSVWIPLAALVNAAGDQYKAGLLTALGIPPGLGEKDINDGVSGMLYNLTRQREKKSYEEFYKEFYGEKQEGSYREPLKIANAIFVDHDMTIKQGFAQAFMDYFLGVSINVDFESPAAAGEVNEWVKKHTNGMIPEIVKGFDTGTAAVIANAIYFFDRWDQEFDPDETEEDVFYVPEEETSAFYMLREGDGLIYYEDETLQALPLGFENGSGMYILLPKDGDASGLLASLTDGYFNDIQAGSVLAQGKLLLPRFSIEGDVMSFGNILETLGVPLFNEGSLTGVAEGTALQLSDVLHKAVIKVDEKGTTAAAVTVLPMATSAGPQEPEKVFVMNCNRPFVFVLYDRRQVLFTGMVNRP
ncbi:MAG: serpin family protein [Treponema sp.]|jgi:serine protease inhibitor|nr:serpin family protein [Treponema sp.]